MILNLHFYYEPYWCIYISRIGKNTFRNNIVYKNFIHLLNACKTSFLLSTVASYLIIILFKYIIIYMECIVFDD